MAHDWDALDRLYRKGMINNPVGKAKSIVLTDEGLSESERLFRKLFERVIPTTDSTSSCPGILPHWRQRRGRRDHPTDLWRDVAVTGGEPIL